MYAVRNAIVTAGALILTSGSGSSTGTRGSRSPAAGMVVTVAGRGVYMHSNRKLVGDVASICSTTRRMSKGSMMRAQSM